MRRTIPFRGTGTALVTPFTSRGEIDERALRGLVDFQISGGVEALFPTGTTGESVTLSAAEQRRVIEVVVDQSRKRAKVFAGAGSNSTKTAIGLAQAALSAGADGILAVGPYYNKPTQEGYFRHYASIAEAVDAPLIVYNVPTRTSGNIE
jgi:4-hydroxy-tetrahydrodipicolinate synthase